MQLIKTAGNIRIAAEDLNSTADRAIVLVHGWPLSYRMWDYQIKPLLDRNWRIVRMDLRGFGASDAPAQNYGYDILAADIYKVIRSLGVKRFAFVGFSMGGAIALRYMRLFGGAGVEKLALLGAAAPTFTQQHSFSYGVTKEYVDELIGQIQSDRAQFSYDFSRMLLAGLHSEAILDWFMDISEHASQIGTIQTAYSLRDENGIRDLDAVHIPTGIFHGKLDQIVGFEHALYQHEHIPGSILYPFENSGHAVFYDELERFSGKFLEFLET